MGEASDALQARAEILKLARILEREPDQLAYLERLSLADLRELRDQATEVLWNANSATLKRLAAASRLLPAGLNATISERAFGALLTARMAGLLEPARAVDVARKLPTPFLASVAIELDPRRASAVISQIAASQIAEVTRELVGRGEYVTMGRFVAHLSDDALAAALGAMDDATLLRVGFVLEDKARLEQLAELLPTERLGAIIQAAADADLWLEALDLLTHLNETQADEIVTTALKLDDAALEAIVAAVLERDLWEEALMIAERDETLQGKLAERLPALPARQRKAIARRAKELEALDRLGVLGEALAKA